MGFFSSFDISASALTSMRTKMDILSQNLANSDTTRTAAGGPYIKKSVVLKEKREFKDLIKPSINNNAPQGLGVDVAEIKENPNAVRLCYEPGHPDADANGYVKYPDVNILDEMVEMIKASRIFEANMTALYETKMMYQKSLEIGK